MPFWVCYYHLIWTTRNRLPVITPRIEPLIYRAIQSKSAELGCVAVCIKPALAVGAWVSQVKGASSHAVNVTQNAATDRFRWQEGYGVLTFGEKQLPLVKDYIVHQKEHHTGGNVQPYLERVEDEK